MMLSRAVAKASPASAPPGLHAHSGACAGGRHEQGL